LGEGVALSTNRAFCASGNRAFIASTNRARGCADYQVVLGTVAQRFGFVNVNDETKLSRWKSVWLFNQKLELQASTVSGTGGPVTGSSTAFQVAAVQGGDFVVNNGRRMTFEVPPVVVWNGITNDSFYQAGLDLSPKRNRVFTKSSNSYFAYDMDSGAILNTTSVSQLMASQNAVVSAPVSAPAEPWGCYVQGEKFSGFTAIASDLISLSEDWSVRWRVDLGLMKDIQLAVDPGGVVVAGHFGTSNQPHVKRFDTDGNLLWTWTDPGFNVAIAVASNSNRVVLSTTAFPLLSSTLVLLNAATGSLVSSASGVNGQTGGGIAIGPDGCVFVAGRAEAPNIPLAFRAIWKYDAQLNFVKYAVNLEGGTLPHDVRIAQKL
jgi:hypothetical protein